DVHRRAIPGGNPEDIQHFAARCRRRVVDAHADSQRTLLQSGFNALIDLRQLGVSGRTMSCIASGQPGARIFITFIRVGMCPMLTPKLMSDLPSRSAYQPATSAVPASSSSDVVTPSCA